MPISTQHINRQLPEISHLWTSSVSSRPKQSDLFLCFIARRISVPAIGSGRIVLPASPLCCPGCFASASCHPVSFQPLESVDQCSKQPFLWWNCHHPLSSYCIPPQGYGLSSENGSGENESSGNVRFTKQFISAASEMEQKRPNKQSNHLFLCLSKNNENHSNTDHKTTRLIDLDLFRFAVLRETDQIVSSSSVLCESGFKHLTGPHNAPCFLRGLDPVIVLAVRDPSPSPFLGLLPASGDYSASSPFQILRFSASPRDISQYARKRPPPGSLHLQAIEPVDPELDFCLGSDSASQA
ncbi:hypothetical protein KSP40_PGU017434 [Platanthera guangdongensis]|uniref:Uncharacterized protein n=1 Tax=Platanthera guangdongensis TaxID=2320717 RepID=A0ABR2LJW2_9ASPA